MLDLREVIGLDKILDGVLLQGVGVLGGYHRIFSLLSRLRELSQLYLVSGHDF
jgi:hypothetical protein